MCAGWILWEVLRPRGALVRFHLVHEICSPVRPIQENGPCSDRFDACIYLIVRRRGKDRRGSAPRTWYGQQESKAPAARESGLPPVPIRRAFR